MKRMMRITTATLFGATMLATPALAQTVDVDPSGIPVQTGETPSVETGVETGAAAGVNTGTAAGVDTSTTAAIDTDFDSALDMMADGSAAAAIHTMTNVGDIRVIHVSTLENSDEARVEQAMAESEAQMQELQAAIDGNAAVKAQLEAQSVATADVLAADVAADGGVIVYVR